MTVPAAELPQSQPEELAVILELRLTPLTFAEATYTYFKWLNNHYPVAGVAEFGRDDQNRVYVVAQNGDHLYS